MKITFILPPVNMSGGIRVVAIYADLLKKRGHHVVLISPPPKKLSMKEKVKKFFRSRNYREQDRALSHLDGLDLDHRVLDYFRPPTDSDVPNGDVIVATWWETAEWVKALDESKGVKIYFIQGYEIFPYLPVERVKRTYQFPFHKIVVSKWLKQVMEEEYRDEVLGCVPNAIDHTQFFAEPRGKRKCPTVGFIYSPSQFKGMDTILKSIERLHEQFSNLQVISFGLFRPEAFIPLGENVTYYYRPAQAELRSIYSRLDVWLTASRSEGFNLPAMEAMACRTPVVATKTGWPAEAIVSGFNGDLVDIDDWKGLAFAAESILKLPNNDWKHVSNNAFETTKKYNWESSAEMFVSSLIAACEKGHKKT